MANNFKHRGDRVTIRDASAALSSGKPTVQENLFGIVLQDVASGAVGQMGVTGVWNIAVPASTVKGDFLYLPSTIGGVLLTDVADATATLTRTASNANAPVCQAITDRDTPGNADVVILARGSGRAATQV
jgi:predicted RecA/RadA family phage recombinase